MPTLFKLGYPFTCSRIGPWGVATAATKTLGKTRIAMKMDLLRCLYNKLAKRLLITKYRDQVESLVCNMPGAILRETQAGPETQ